MDIENDNPVEIAVFEIVGRYVKKKHINKMSPDADLLQDLRLSQNDFIEIIHVLEEHFDINIPDDDALDEFFTINDIIVYLTAKKSLTAIKSSSNST